MKNGKVLTQRMVQELNYKNSPCNKDCKDRCVGCKKGCEKLLFFNLFEKIKWKPEEHVYYGASKHDDSGRKEAKKNKDFALADQIRNELLAKGIELVDTREGATYRIIGE